MSQIVYDEADAGVAIRTLVEWGLVEPESLLIEDLKDADAVRVHASGFIHLRFLLPKFEYLVGVTPDLSVSSREVAERLGTTWSSRRAQPDINLASKSVIVSALCEYVRLEYERRCNRHPFYRELGLGGRAAAAACENAVQFAQRRGPTSGARLL